MDSSISHPVTFTTSTQHVLPPSKYMIPTNWARFQLSQLLNKVLELSTPTPFDFLVRGELLQGTIAEWCEERGIKEEETLEIEYFESLMPPKFLSRFGNEEEEWFSSVCCTKSGFILAGSYDNTAKLYDTSQQLLHSIRGHNGPVTSVCWVPQSMDDDSGLILSGSHDGTARISRVQLAQQASSTDPEPLVSLRLHSGPISSIAANSAGSHVLTAGWDGLLGLFNTEVPKEDEVPDDAELVGTRRKRRKVQAEPAVQAKRKAPIHVLRGHTGKVTQGLFDSSGTRAYSAGFDSTIRRWDIEMGVSVDTITANAKPMTGLALTSDDNTLVATSTDRVVSVYDARVAPSGVPPMLPHTSLPSCLAAHPRDAHKIITGAYDGVARVWDLRSTKGALSAFEVKGRAGATTSSNTAGVDRKKKILGVHWGNGFIGIAGEGGLEVWRVNDGGDIIR